MAKERIVFVHGAGSFGAAAWPNQHKLALEYDCLFLRRHGFGPTTEPLPTDFDADRNILLEALGDGGHVVAHSYGAISALMAALARPDKVASLALFEPACSSLTEGLPATQAHRELLEPLMRRRAELTDEEFERNFMRIMFSAQARRPSSEPERRAAGRLRLQAPPWEAPLSIVPGVPMLVVTGGWEPLYEEIAEYLVTTGAEHVRAGGDHRPQDTPEGHQALVGFLRAHPL